MRGKEYVDILQRAEDRITPAHAGKSAPYSSQCARSKDHPRPCGEKFVGIGRIGMCPGSPPPMRGKAIYSFGGSTADRITPAHAGKRLHRLRLLVSNEDHPRPCGEKKCR